jgi:AraC-like DNA-binding protein
MQDFIKPSLEYIEQNLKTDITTDELAQMTGYSVGHYCRLFTQITGSSVANYITQKRVNYALAEISSGRKAVDVVYDYGFDTYAGFYKAFVKMYGCSPSKMVSKKQIQKDLTPKELEEKFMDYMKIAKEALNAYSINNASNLLIEFINQSEGAVYKVTADNNKLYCLKLYISATNDIPEKATVNSELEWVAAIARDTDITVPESYKNRNGEYVTVVDGICCSLMKWLDGEQAVQNRMMWALFGDEDDINERDDREEAFSYIKVIGTLHKHSSEWIPPAGFERPINDFTDTGFEEVLAGFDILNNLDTDMYNKSNLEIIKQAGIKAMAKKKTYEKNNKTWGLVHDGFIWFNYIINNKEIYPIDFAGCGYNYYMANLAQGMHFTSPFKKQFFLDMYSKYFPLPDDYVSQLETFTITTELQVIGHYLKREDRDSGWLAADFNYWANGEFGWYLNDEPFLFNKKAFYQFQ